MSERHIELTWHCASCHHKNLGRHMQCEQCGKPKTDAEEYEMPADTRAAAAVDEPELLQKARAGENWHCKYCGYDQRDLEGACGQCGAGRTARAKPRIKRAPSSSILRDRRLWAAVFVFCFLATCAVMVKHKNHVPDPALSMTSSVIIVAPPVRTDFAATVTSVSWQTEVRVERWALVAHAGFSADVPDDAINARAAGVHFHHDEDVFDHDETVYDEVQVPDGTRTETYSDRVACGQDCTASTRSCHQVCTQNPQSCHEVCTNKKNGFASCHDVCSGGGQTCHDECSGSDGHCETKYCDQTRTREVAKTRTDKRPRTVHKYRSEPRNEPWSTWAQWEWAPVRDVTASGDDLTPTWPDAGVIAYRETASDAGTERAIRIETMRVTLALDDGSTRIYTPLREDEFAELAPNTQLRVRANGSDLMIFQDAQ